MKRLRYRKGFFLVLVTAVVAALTAILVRFGVNAQSEVLTAGHFRDEIVAEEAARSVLAGVKAAIIENKWQIPELIPLIAGQMALKGRCRGKIEDEASKLPVNQLVLAGEDGMAVLERYWVLRGLSGRVFQALTDWIDADDTTAAGRGESSAYGKAGVYFRNAPLQSVYELSLIPGWPEMTQKMGKLGSAAARDLTVCGDGKINLLTAGRDVLSALSDEMTPQLLDQIIEAREMGRIQSIGDFKKISRMNDTVFRAFQRWGTLNSKTFRVLIEATHQRGRFRLLTVLRRQENGVRTIYYREGFWQPM